MCCEATKGATHYLRRTWGKGPRTFWKVFDVHIVTHGKHKGDVVLLSPYFSSKFNGKLKGPGWKESSWVNQRRVVWFGSPPYRPVDQGMHAYRKPQLWNEPTKHRVKHGRGFFYASGVRESIQIPVEVRKEDFMAAEPVEADCSEIVATRYHLRQSVWDSVVAVLTGDRA